VWKQNGGNLTFPSELEGSPTEGHFLAPMQCTPARPGACVALNPYASADIPGSCKSSV